MLTHHRPALRNALVRDLRDFVVLFQIGGTSINWPHSIDEAIHISPETGHATVSDAFAKHASNVDNWSFTHAFMDAFPEMAGHVRVVKGPFDHETNPDMSRIYEKVARAQGVSTTDVEMG